MCGINGILKHGSTQLLEDSIRRMNKQMEHRGPDAQGIWVDNEIALGHQRLSILDLNPRSNQPFQSPDGRYMMVFNGEIYNYKDIKQSLQYTNWQTESDTEVLLHAFIQWKEQCLQLLNGMFAFAVWDNHEKELFVARDRLGIKPLYFYTDKDTFIFSSEIRSILASGFVEKKLNTTALSDYLMYLTVHAPQTIVKNVQMLLPAHYIKVSDGVLTAEKYWLPETNVQFINPSRKDAVAEVREKLKQAVRKRLVSDVSFGAFLSGGIDSSAVVALMAQEMDRPVETFNIAFNESEFSEAKYARMIAAKYKTRHHEIVIRPDEFVNHIPAALDAMDHPGADGPNTWVVSRAAKQAGVTMVLSGLGGDEFFGGYDVFKRIPTLDERKWLLSFPRPLRSAAGFLLRTMKPSVSSEKTASLLVQDYWHLEYTYRFSRMTVLEKDIKEMLIGQPKVINRVYNIVKDLCGPEKPGQRFDRFTQISLAEMNTYLPNVLLRDTDQMSMAHALEVRVPMLDHKVVEYLLSLPAHLKQSATSPKQLLVEAMGNDLPSQLIDRPKMGFTFPWKEWLKKDLYELTSSHLESLSNRPEFNKAFISRIWQSFLTDDPRSRWAVIWNLVVLEHYLQKNGIQ